MLPDSSSMQVVKKPVCRKETLPYGVFRAGNRYLSSVLCGSKTTFCGIYNTVDAANFSAQQVKCGNAQSVRVTYSGI